MQKSKKKIWIALAAVIVIAVIFAVVYFRCRAKDKRRLQDLYPGGHG